MGSGVGKRNIGARDHGAARIGDCTNNAPVCELSLGKPGKEARADYRQSESDDPQEQPAPTEHSLLHLSLLHDWPPNHSFATCLLVEIGVSEPDRESPDRSPVCHLQGYVPAIRNCARLRSNALPRGCECAPQQVDFPHLLVLQPCLFSTPWTARLLHSISGAKRAGLISDENNNDSRCHLSTHGSCHFMLFGLHCHLTMSVTK